MFARDKVTEGLWPQPWVDMGSLHPNVEACAEAFLDQAILEDWGYWKDWVRDKDFAPHVTTIEVKCDDEIYEVQVQVVMDYRVAVVR